MIKEKTRWAFLVVFLTHVQTEKGEKTMNFQGGSRIGCTC